MASQKVQTVALETFLDVWDDWQDEYEISSLLFTSAEVAPEFPPNLVLEKG